MTSLKANSCSACICGHSVLEIALGFFLTIGILGCGSSGRERVIVSGKVSFNGQPVKTGQIRFFPDTQVDSPTSGAYIVDGRYTADSKGGVPVGKFRVEILAFEPPKAPNPNAPPIVAEMASRQIGKQFLPEKFNTNSDLSLSIQTGSSPITQDFELTD